MPVKYVKPHVKKGGGSYFSRHIQTERNSQRVFTFISVRAFFTHSGKCDVLTLRNLEVFFCDKENIAVIKMQHFK